MIGTFGFALSAFFSPDAPRWTIPAIILGSAAPWVAAAAYGPTVANIRVALPANARRSREGLVRWASNVPAGTGVRVQFIRFMPWFVTKSIYFEDLRRLPPSRIRLSNLEHIPLSNRGRPRAQGLGGWFVRMYFGRYWVNMLSGGKERAQVPGVWASMWRQIPWADEEREVRTRDETERRGRRERKPPGGGVGGGVVGGAWPRRAKK